MNSVSVLRVKCVKRYEIHAELIKRCVQKQAIKKRAIKKQAIKKQAIKKQAIKKQAIKKQAIKDNRIAAMQAETVMDYLTGHPTAKTKDIAVRLKVSDPRARAILARLVEKEVLIAEGSNRDWKI